MITARTAIVMLAVLSMPLILSACNIAQVVETVARPDPEVEARHDIPDRTTVVLVDDPGSHVNPVRLRRGHCIICHGQTAAAPHCDGHD